MNDFGVVTVSRDGLLAHCYPGLTDFRFGSPSSNARPDPVNLTIALRTTSSSTVVCTSTKQLVRRDAHLSSMHVLVIDAIA